MSEIVFTNHVRQRAKERGIDLKELDRTVRFPDKVTKGKEGSRKHTKNFSSHQIVVPLKRQGNKWITVSVWKNSRKGSLPKSSPFFLERFISYLLRKLEQFLKRRS